MTRLEIIRILLSQAQENGFEFRRWYVKTIGLPWQSKQHAAEMLAAERRYYALLFSHEFAQCFWKAGATITFLVPSQTFQRSQSDGSISTVIRKSFIRRSGRKNAWMYHLRELAAVDEPLRYMRRYLHVVDEMEEDG